jgi:hypothetical protein
MMHLLTRRRLLGAALIPAALALNNCVGPSQTAAPLPQFAADVQTIAAALTKILPDVQNAAGASAATVSVVESAIAKAQTLAGDIATAASSSGDVVSLIASFAENFMSIASALGFGVPGVVGTVLQAGAALLPTILAASGAAAPMARRGRAMASTMTPGQARAVLQALAEA